MVAGLWQRSLKVWKWLIPGAVSHINLLIVLLTIDCTADIHIPPLAGMAFGTGSAIAHRAVGAVAGALGGGSSEAAPSTADAASAAPASQATGAACAVYQRDFTRCIKEVSLEKLCMKRTSLNISSGLASPLIRLCFPHFLQNKNDIGTCQMYMDSFDQCQAQAGTRMM